MFNHYLSVFYGVFIARVGTGTSCALLVFSCLFPLISAASETVGASAQLEQEMTQLLSREVNQWQLKLGIKELTAKIKVRVPSGAKRLQFCSGELAIDSGDIPLGNIQRKVSCEAQGWSLYVRASVKVKARVPVANRPLKRGDHISITDIDWQVVSLDASDRNLLSQLDQILGRKVVRKLRRYQPIRSQQLDDPQWVNIGDRVIIEARSNGFYANMPGEALEGGGQGKAIRVKNLSSGKVIVAYPIAKGRVQTQF
ncbi:flagellar basal body P-ring formation chaperone FlgA [Shewanella sairae]|uniref:flagellar basal body P-ring formation chaperone FlgA n=1 Tax=Shewanella sairae TaxID=190310 RepID=UPI001C8254D0|nr:flagellar basal body P-ring formation chaperone FlgA [Shewanella sairae]MCL1130567.1 flagellar basal body P-ring formation protein FlgA [Shewanella sairae]